MTSESSDAGEVDAGGGEEVGVGAGGGGEFTEAMKENTRAAIATRANCRAEIRHEARETKPTRDNVTESALATSDLIPPTLILLLIVHFRNLKTKPFYNFSTPNLAENPQ
jgi:hypothetical protein